MFPASTGFTCVLPTLEPTFATVRARSDPTKGPGSREAGVAMFFKFLEAQEGRWRRIDGPHLGALVRARTKFENRELIEGNEEKYAV